MTFCQHNTRDGVPCPEPATYRHANGAPCDPFLVCAEHAAECLDCEPLDVIRVGDGSFIAGVVGYATKDSGQRRAFETGSQRDDATGKGRYDLLPREAIHRLAQLYERGAEKYDARNWEKGQPLSVVTNSMLRHAFQAAAGLDDEDHLAAVAWNAFAAITIKERVAAGLLPPELDDLPKREAA